MPFAAFPRVIAPVGAIKNSPLLISKEPGERTKYFHNSMALENLSQDDREFLQASLHSIRAKLEKLRNQLIKKFRG